MLSSDTSRALCSPFPIATIHTLMELMEDGRAFKPYMDTLELGETLLPDQFPSPHSPQRKAGVEAPLGRPLHPAFDRMFSEKSEIDADAFSNGGKIILVNTAKDVLKEEGSRLFEGASFMAMLVQATVGALPSTRSRPQTHLRLCGRGARVFR